MKKILVVMLFFVCADVYAIQLHHLTWMSESVSSCNSRYGADCETAPACDADHGGWIYAVHSNGAVPAGYHYNHCVVPLPPEVICPAVGEKTYLESCTTGSQIPQINVDGSGEYTDSDGCKSTLQADDAAVWPDSEIKIVNGVEQSCTTSQYTSTGEKGTPPAASEEPPTSRENMDSGSEKPIKETQEYTETVDPTQTTNDGAGTETKVDKTTEEIDKPTVIKDTKTEYLRRDGDNIKKTTTTTTTTNPDGSTTTKTDVDYRQTTGDEVKIDKDTGAVTIKPSHYVDSGTSTTKTRDATGKTTGGTSTSYGGAGTDNGSVKGGNTGTSGTSNDPGDGKEGDDKEDEEGEECKDCKFDGQAPDADGLYDQTDKTYESVLTGFKSSVFSSPIVSSIGGFFDVTTSASSCPIWSANIPFMNTDITIDIFCSNLMLDILLVIKIGLLFGFTFVAFKWAFL